MHNFLAMLMEDANIYNQAFFVKIILTPEGNRKVEIEGVSTSEAHQVPASSPWLLEYISFFDKKYQATGVKKARVGTSNPMTGDDITIYYSDETDEISF